MKALSIVIVILLICGTYADLFFHNHPLQQVTKANNWLNVPEVIKYLPTDMTESRISSFDLDVLDLKESNDFTIQSALRNMLPANYTVFFSVPTADILTAISLRNHAYLDQQSLSLILSAERLQQEQPYGNTPLVIDDDLFRLKKLQGVRYYLSLIPLSNPELTLLWQFPLPREISGIFPTGISNMPGKLFLLPLPISGGYLYELSNWVPRVKMFSHARVAATDDEAFKAIQEATFDPQTTLVITNTAPVASGSGESNAIIKENNNTNLTITTSGSGGWLYVADTYYPGWQATIDGIETKIYRANIAFRAVSVPPGNHQVEFVYRPVSRTIGTGITILTFVIFLVLIQRSLLPRSLNHPKKPSSLSLVTAVYR